MLKENSTLIKVNLMGNGWKMNKHVIHWIKSKMLLNKGNWIGKEGERELEELLETKTALE